MKIYLDNSAATQVDKAVLKTMLPYFRDEYGNASSLHSMGIEARKALEKARTDIAKIINAEPEEIIFTSGGTESDNLAIKGIANKGKHIITSKIEHPAIMSSCKTLEKQEYKVTYLNVDKNGIVDLKQLEKAIRKDTVLVSIMMANNEIGSIQPIKEIGEICKKNGVLFHTDAVQAFTRIPIDVKKLNIDLMSISSHKIHGPKGIGALYVKKGTKIKRQMDGGGHEFKLRAGTENVAGAVGFAKAATLDPKVKYISKLRDYLIKKIEQNIRDIKLNGPKNRLCNNVNFSFKYIEGEALLTLLDEKGIYVSTGSACASKTLAPSHVLLAMGSDPVIAHGSIRFSLSKFNNKKELDYVVKELKIAVNKLRRISPYGI